MSASAERTIDISTAIYSLDAVKKAVYKFSDRLFAQLHQEEGRIRIVFRPAAPGADLERLEGELLAEILDQDLRERVARETEGLRNLILAHALSKVPLLGAGLEDADFEEAPELSNPES